MTVETDTKLLSMLEKFIETSNQKFEKFIETLTTILVNQARFEGKLETIEVKIETLEKGQIKLENEIKETKNEISSLYKWVIGTFIIALVGIANIFLKFFDLLPRLKTQ
jgi:predicted nuclease with TOPRIM domain